MLHLHAKLLHLHAKLLSCLRAVPPAQSTPSSTGSGRDAPRHLSPSRSRVLSILLPAECTTLCLFQDLTLALCVHCTESALKMTRFPPVPTWSPLSHRRDELVVRSRLCHHTRQPNYTSQNHLHVSPHTSSLCPRTGGRRQSHLFFPPWRTSTKDRRTEEQSSSRAFAEPRGHCSALQMSFCDISRLVCRHESAFPFIRAV